MKIEAIETFHCAVGTRNQLLIKVITENGEVFLLGLIDRKQADLAVEIARNTAGVRKVVKVFEYTEPAK